MKFATIYNTRNRAYIEIENNMHYTVELQTVFDKGFRFEII